MLRLRVTLAIILIALGAAMAGGGFYLIWLGGSFYYAIAGLTLIAAAVLIWRDKSAGVLLYWAFFLFTIIWALWEVGSDHWALLPRLTIFALVGLILLPRLMRMMRTRRPIVIAAGVVGALGISVGIGLGLHAISPNQVVDPAFDRGIATARAPVAAPGFDGDWLHYGNDSGGQRFSALTQINPDNVASLVRAWEYRVGPGADGAYGNIEATPLQVGNRLFFCTSYNDVIALNAESGKEEWRFRSGIDRKGFPYGQCRGVAYYKVPDATGACAERIITNTIDARLLALDARTGQACRDFGTQGETSLLTGLGQVDRGYYFVTSAPTIVRGKIVLGGWVADGQYWGEPSGVIRGYDAVTGRFAWAFDIGRPDRQTEPPPGESYTRATPNSWAPMSADETLGLVYAPTGNATPDYYGAQRCAFDDRYSSSVVAIDAETGKVRWSFQTIHHDIWDHDVAAQPVLTDIPTADGVRKAVIQATKRGELYVLDRVTGRPLADVVEKPVPQRGAAPGERVSPTQPFSVGVPSLAGPDLTETMMWGLTPLDQLWCRIMFKGSRYDGKFTPPGLTTSLTYPGYAGGITWGSVSIDADRHLLITNSTRLATRVRLLPREEADRKQLFPMTEERRANIGGAVAQAGTPYGVDVMPFLSPFNVPCQQPPYGMLSAIDLVSQKIVWTQPLGSARDSGPFKIPSGLPFTMGLPNKGGSVVTRGGVTFIGATQDAYLRAFETVTGKLLWEARLPAAGNANPVTYLSKDSGRQFVVISASGHGGLQNHTSDHIVAYALPR